VPKDLSKARELYAKACDGKEPDGCKGLAALDR
jgi:TPR repeat protein